MASNAAGRGQRRSSRSLRPSPATGRAASPQLSLACRPRWRAQRCQSLDYQPDLSLRGCSTFCGVSSLRSSAEGLCRRALHGSPRPRALCSAATRAVRATATAAVVLPWSAPHRCRCSHGATMLHVCCNGGAACVFAVHGVLSQHDVRVCGRGAFEQGVCCVVLGMDSWAVLLVACSSSCDDK